MSAKTAIAGELSLAGEVRPIRRLPARVRTARNLGFTEFLGPASSAGTAVEAGAEVMPTEGFSAFRNVRGVVKALFSPKASRTVSGA